MSIYLALLLIFGGVGLVLLGSEVVVHRAQLLARRLNVSELIVGLTVVSFGSNMPEIATAIRVGLAQRAGENASGVVIGNIIGSSLVNATLLIGVCAIITTLRIDRATYKRESIAMGVALLMMLLATMDGRVDVTEAAVLIVSYLLYMLVLGRLLSRLMATDHVPERLKKVLHLLHLRPIHEEDVLEENIHHPPVVQRSVRQIIWDIVLMIVGISCVALGAEWIVTTGLFLAKTMGLHTVVIGVLLGLFTSIPEVTVAIKALNRGSDGLVLGNLMGGNILNPLFTLGISALIAPIQIETRVLFFELPFLIVGTVMALILLRDRNDLDRFEGLTLVIFYALFLFLSLFTFA